MVLQPSSLTLASHPASTARSVIRIAAALKSAPLTLVNQHFEFFKEFNRNIPGPTLTVTYPSTEQLIIKQSLAMLDFVDEAYVGPLQLVPPITDIRKRYWTRDLAALVQTEIHPLQRYKFRRMFERIGGDTKLWIRNVQTMGLRNYEVRVRHSMGKYSVGDEPTLADVYLYPMVLAARKRGIIVEKLGLKLVMKIMEECDKLNAFRMGVIDQEIRPTQAGQEDPPNKTKKVEAADDEPRDEAGNEEAVPLSRTMSA